jgi:hypothetical protein
LTYDDATWASGPAELGYGDDGEGRPETTVVGFGPDPNSKFITTYFRRSIVVTNAAAFTDLTINLMRDDGAAVYLNGTNVFVSNLPAGPIDYLTLAPNSIGGTEEYGYFAGSVSPSLLREGINVLAVEVHQTAPNSSDISFDLELSGHRLPINQPPLVNAGTAQSIDISGAAQLSGSISDDGLPIPPGLLTVEWSKVSGPGSVNFENSNSARTMACFGVAGVYSLRLAASDGIATRTADVTVTVSNGIAGWKARYFISSELLDPAISGDDADPDQDGQTNLQEYIADTNPRNPLSRLYLEALPGQGYRGVALRFNAVAGKAYAIDFRDGLENDPWQHLAEIQPSPTNRFVEIPDYQSSGASTRFYRLITPPN